MPEEPAVAEYRVEQPAAIRIPDQRIRETRQRGVIGRDPFLEALDADFRAFGLRGRRQTIWIERKFHNQDTN